MENHYALLGLPEDASITDIETALERMAAQADAIVYTAPERSRELWGRIRQARADLLSGGEKRAAYTLRLQQEQIAPPVISVPAQHVAPAPPIPPTTIGSIARPVPRAIGSKLNPLLLPLLVAAAIASIALTVDMLTNQPSGKGRLPFAQPLPPPPISHQLSSRTSGKTATLHWTPIQNAVVYRLQIATDDSFRHALRTALTDQPIYVFNTAEGGRYYWRVQVYVDGAWQPYSHGYSFVIHLPAARPTVHGGEIAMGGYPPAAKGPSPAGKTLSVPLLPGTTSVIALPSIATAPPPTSNAASVHHLVSHHHGSLAAGYPHRQRVPRVRTHHGHTHILSGMTAHPRGKHRRKRSATVRHPAAVSTPSPAPVVALRPAAASVVPQAPIVVAQMAPAVTPGRHFTVAAVHPVSHVARPAIGGVNAVPARGGGHSGVTTAHTASEPSRIVAVQSRQSTTIQITARAGRRSAGQPVNVPARRVVAVRQSSAPRQQAATRGINSTSSRSTSNAGHGGRRSGNRTAPAQGVPNQNSRSAPVVPPTVSTAPPSYPASVQPPAGTPAPSQQIARSTVPVLGTQPAPALPPQSQQPPQSGALPPAQAGDRRSRP